MIKENETITQEIFHDEGKNILVKMFFRNGTPHGESITQNKNGEVIQRANFVEGKLHGPFILFDKKKIKARLNYKADKLDGKAEYFDENEKVIGMENYKDGMKDGITEWKDMDGKLLFKENFRAGLLHGDKLEYYPSGKLKKKTQYSQGEIIGEPEEYEENEKAGVGETKKKKSRLQPKIVFDTTKKFLLAKLGFQ